MDRRSLFYWSREYSRGIKAGQDYQELPNVIAINIIDFEFIPMGNFHTSFHLREDSEKSFMLTDALEIHFIDMVKFRALEKKDIRNDPLHRWLSYFDKDSPPEIVEEVVKMDTAIKKAEEKVSYVSQDKEALRAYQMREMALSDYTSGINYAKREGIKEVARKALEEGATIEFVSKITGWDTDTIKKL
jgi:predicted transposase/invertase (TIGR01784 family)